MTKDPRYHNLADIKAILEPVVLAQVDREGRAIKPPSVTLENATQHGWICTRCEVRFGQWAAVLAHLTEHHAPTPNPMAKERKTAQGYSKKLLVDIVHFAHEVLGLNIDEPTARRAAIMIAKGSILPISDQVTYIVAEYRSVKGYGEQEKTMPTLS